MRRATGATMEPQERRFYLAVRADSGGQTGAKQHVRHKTIQDRPGEWTAGVQREVYDFQPGGSGLANRTDLYIEGKFRNDTDPKDGFLVRDCRDSRERRLLEFLVPIVHPDKPTRVTRTIGNTIFRAMSGDRPVDWGKVFSKLVQRLVGAAGKARSTPICPFLYHLYKCKGLLTKKKKPTTPRPRSSTGTKTR